jgi:hypothetical protein
MEYYGVGFTIVIFGHKDPKLPDPLDKFGINSVTVYYTRSCILYKIKLVRFSVHPRGIQSLACTSTVHAGTQIRIKVKQK